MTDNEKQPEGKPRKAKLFGVATALATIVIGVLVASVVIRWPGDISTAKLEAEGVKMACRVRIPPGRRCLVQKASLCEEDLEIARIAWKYFENNYQKTTGLVNSADRYPSTTMWDTGSALGATVAAREFGLITQKEFDDRVVGMLATLNDLELFNDEAPNKAYNTATGAMVDYNNNASPDGIGVSTLDLARLINWLNLLSCFQPQHTKAAEAVILKWKYCRLIKDGEMYGLLRDPVTKEIEVLQEGRIGYEQYAGKVFEKMGFDMSISGTYQNEYTTSVDIYGVPIVYDSRDPRKLGAYNYVVTESYAMDMIEHGLDEENTPLMENVIEVQRRRWEKTGYVTAVSEDNIDREPWFVYNTIFAAGSAWNAITDTGLDMAKLKSLSTKAAMSVALLFPEREYSEVLFNAVRSAYDPDRGWFSGIYESGIGYNKAITANTNGVIMSALLYKMYGALNRGCDKCSLGLRFDHATYSADEHQGKCLPGTESCSVCSG